MRKIEGIVCTARTGAPEKQERLFGPNTGDSDFNHQTFTSNGLKPFLTEADARQGLQELRRRKKLFLTHTGLALVKMELTSSDDEWELLRGRKSYIIVIGSEHGDYTLLGKKVDGIIGLAYAPVSDLGLNGFRTINNFNLLVEPDITGIMYEVRRQGRPHTSQIATFEMRRLKSR